MDSIKDVDVYTSNNSHHALRDGNTPTAKTPPNSEQRLVYPNMPQNTFANRQ